MNTTGTEPLVIVCAADEGYVMPLAAMIKSVLVNADARHAISLYVIDGGIQADDKERLVRSWTSEQLTVHWVRLDDAVFAHLPVWGRMNVNVYHRLMMPHCLPPALQKAVWLDCDLIVKGNVAGLWDLELGEKALLAVQDMVVPYVSSRYGVAYYKELGLAQDAKHFNSGVMVVNLDWWRRNDVTERVFAYLWRYRRTVLFWDQEGLNAVLAGQWGELDPRWNQIASVSGRSFFTVQHLDEAVYRQVVDAPWIVHFAGTWKPWMYHNQSPSRALYFHYLDMTAWAGWRPRKTLKTLILGIYEAILRDTLYPAEKWRMRLIRRRDSSNGSI